MTTSTTTTNVSIVTPEQIATCSRVYNEQGQAFYMVTSESDPTQEYTVKAMLVNGRYFLTCDCKAGMSGTPCKHKRYATAAAQIDRTQVKVEAMSHPTVWKEEVGLVVDGDEADELTTRRVMSATAKPISKGKGRTDTKVFSLLGR